MKEWTRSLKKGGALVVTFLLTTSTDVAKIHLDLLGDGEVGWEIEGTHLKHVSQLTVVPRKAGNFLLDITITDVVGCKDRTAQQRFIEVIP